MSNNDLLGAFRLLHPLLRNVIKNKGYISPTLVQEKAIPRILTGINTMVVAPTGSGKTEAALFPILSMIIEKGLSGGLVAIYITPLRSLNRDLWVRLNSIASDVGIKILVRHGDSTQLERRKFLLEPPNIMITTPETLYFLLSVERFRRSLSGLRFIIVDELHELAYSKRGVELSLAISRMLRLYCKHRVQLIGLSATLRDPYEAFSLIFGPKLFSLVDVATPVDKMEIKVITTSENGDDALSSATREITKILNETEGSVLIFTNTRDLAEILGASLRKILGDNISVHHGSLDREVRLITESELRSGKLKAVVATSSLELGIDIGRVDVVIQYMSPRQAIKLIQRIGRSRHKYWLTSKGIIVSTRNIFDILESSVIARRAKWGHLERSIVYRKAYDVLAHQLVGLVLEVGSIEIDKAYELFLDSWSYRDLFRDEFIQIVKELDSIGVLKVRGNKLYPGRRAAKYYYSVTMIPDVKHFTIRDAATKKKIGVVSEEFVATLDKGEEFVLGGLIWEVVDIDSETNTVYVIRKVGGRLIPPAWEGELIPVEYGVAREVGSIFRRFRKYGPEVLKEYPLEDNAVSFVANTLASALRKDYILPNDREVLIEHYGDAFVVYSFLGTRGNRALEFLLSGYFSEVKGYSPSTSSSPYIVALQFASRQPPYLVEQTLVKLSDMDRRSIEDIINKSIVKSRLYQWVLLHVANRFGFFERKADLGTVKRVLRKLTSSSAGIEALREVMVKYIDLEVLFSFLEQIREKRISIVTKSLRSPSELTQQALSLIGRYERGRERIPVVVIEAIRRRLSSYNVKLVCLLCGNYWSITIGQIRDDNLLCRNCGSRFISPIPYGYSERETSSIIKAARRNQKLSRKEKEVFKWLQEAANLVLSYGVKALEALVHTGVGPSTAKRILQRLTLGEEEFYRGLVEAEIQFYKYRGKLHSRSTKNN